MGARVAGSGRQLVLPWQLIRSRAVVRTQRQALGACLRARSVTLAWQLVGYAFALELSRWSLGGYGYSSRQGAAAPGRHYCLLLPTRRERHPQIIEDCGESCSV